MIRHWTDNSDMIASEYLTSGQERAWVEYTALHEGDCIHQVFSFHKTVVCSYQYISQQNKHTEMNCKTKIHHSKQ